MGIVLDIFKSIFTLGFYREVPKRGVGRAFLHIFLITLLFSSAFCVFINRTVFSEMESFITWASDNFPTIYLNGRELSTNAQEPYFTSYDNGKVNFVFSTKQEFGDYASLDPNTLVFEKTRILFASGGEEIEQYDLSTLEEIPENVSATIDQVMLKRFQDILGRFFFIAAFLGFFFLSFFVYFFVAILFSIYGVILKSISRAELRYDQVLSISIYSLTALNVISILGLLIPILNFPFRNLLFVLITFGYVTAGILLNKPRNEV